MYQQIEVDPDEELVRLFFRGPGQSLQHPNLIDFERRAKVRGAKEGGLSFCRSNLMTYRKMVSMTQKRDRTLPRGLAVAKASTFIGYGYRFFGEPSEAGHVCLHCVECDTSEAACRCSKGVCPFDLDEDDDTRETLASMMKVIIEATQTEVILQVFGKDVVESDPVAANELFMSRWLEYRRAPV